jgi:hypothetical protein
LGIGIANCKEDNKKERKSGLHGYSALTIIKKMEIWPYNTIIPPIPNKCILYCAV